VKVRHSKTFEKQYAKVGSDLQRKVKDRIARFSSDPHDPILNTHALTGSMKGMYSINVTGDVRAIFTIETDTASGTHAYFFALGTHSQLYK